MHPEQVKAWRILGPAGRLTMAADIHRAARDLKASALAQQHPEWTREQVEAKVRDLFIRAVT